MSTQNISTSDLIAFLSANPTLQKELEQKVIAQKEAEKQKEEQYLIDLTKRELNNAIRNSNTLQQLVNNLDAIGNKVSNEKVMDRCYNNDLTTIANAIFFVKNAKVLPTAEKVIEVTKEQYYSGQNLSSLIKQEEKSAEPVTNCIPGFTLEENQILQILKNCNRPLTIKQIMLLVPLKDLEGRLQRCSSSYTIAQKTKLYLNNVRVSVKALVKGKLVIQQISDHRKGHCYEYKAA